MRYQPTHAAPSDSRPFMLRRSKSLRTALAAAVAGAIGLVPVFAFVSPAAATQGDLAIASTPVVEGNDVVFTLEYTGSGAATYTFSTSAASATPGLDYTSAPTPLTVAFTGADTTKTVHVKTTDDSLYEDDETFTLNAVSVGNSDTTTSTGTISDNDTPPSYTLTATSPVTEAAGAKSTVTATLSTASGWDTVVTLNTADGTATSSDYTPLTGSQVTIPAGSLTGTADIAINNDSIKDTADTETFTVNASATNVSPTTRSVQVGIVDAQTAPKLTLSSGAPTVAENGTLTYTVTASGVSELPMSVSWDAVAAPAKDGTNAATPVDDFPYPSSRTVTIAAGTTTQTFTITPPQDNLNELPEDFAVQLVSPTNASLGTTSKVVTEITNIVTDTAPTVSVTPTAVTEGDSGASTKTFTATLSKVSGRTVTAKWNTVDNIATTVAKDYKAADGTLTFPAGTTTQTFTVDILGDTTDEGTGEIFKIHLAPPAGETPVSLIVAPDASITITDDDAAPTFTFDSVSSKEGDSSNAVLLPIKLSNPSNTAITLTISDGTHIPAATASQIVGAVGSNDFQLLNDTVTVLAGTTTGYAVVLVNGDTIYENDETAYFDADVDGGSTAFVTAPLTKQSTFTILNDDKAPDLEINSVTGDEGDTVPLTATVTGTAQDDVTLNITFAGGSVSGSKAASANDFTNPGAKAFVVPAGTDSGSILTLPFSIALTDDTVAEPAETILATGIGLGNVGTVTEGVITIAASDAAPPTTDVTLEANKSVVEGVGTVTLSGKAAASASVQLWAKPVGNANLVKYGNAVTADSDGDFSFNATLTKTGIVFAATSGDATSDEVTVWLRAMPTLTGGSTVKGSVALTVTGNPKLNGQTVTVQRANSNGTWSTVGGGKTNSSGMWSGTVKNLKSGTYVTFRAWAAGNGDVGLLSGTSATKRIGIR
jgi:hypothetical protein